MTEVYSSKYVPPYILTYGKRKEGWRGAESRIYEEA